MIVITGAAGFIGSCLVKRLNDEGYNDLVLVDDFSRDDKRANLDGKKYSSQVHREEFFEWLGREHRFVQFIFHLGARTDTTEFRKEIFDHLNLEYSKKVWLACIDYGLPMVYASSAATYGSGELGYKDDHSVIPDLVPLNPYGESKNDFDKWVITQKRAPFFWAGLKFFNVYGPNEYHKGRMASVVFHAFRQISQDGSVRLFKSHRDEYNDGEQLRDFIYVKDVADVCFFLLHNRKDCGIYNLGSGEARTFLDLARNTFHSMGVDEKIDFIDTPSDIRDKYQYFTEADMRKLRSIGYHRPFTTLEHGVSDYVVNHLMTGCNW
ncbi:MAG: ADP-glyceromanno-heptose 6-epimerase [Bacteroidota bacterium]